MLNCDAKIDLHMHTTVSDGTDTPAEILEQVRSAGIRLFSVTDHDAVKAGRILPPLLGAEDPLFIPGVEFSCRDELGKYHILGYGFDPESDAINCVVDKGHGYRMEKVTARLNGLRAVYGFAIPEDEIAALLAMDNPGKPHIGNLLVKYGYAETKEQAIHDFIDPLRIRNQYIRPEEAIAGILGAGGIPVLAHPAYGSGDELFLGEEMENRLRRLMDFGLQGMEAFYSGFTPRITAEMLALADRYGLYVTAGSDYHGKNKLVKLGSTGLDGEETFPSGLVRFLEAVGVSRLT